MKERLPYRLEWRDADLDARPLALWRDLATAADVQRAALDLMRSNGVLDTEFRLGGPGVGDAARLHTSGGAISRWRPERDPLPEASPTPAWDRTDDAAAKAAEVADRVRTAMREAADHGIIGRLEAAKAIRSATDALDDDESAWE